MPLPVFQNFTTLDGSPVAPYPNIGMHLGHQGVKKTRRDRGRGHAHPVVPVVGLVERAGGNAIAARAVVLDPEIEALLGVAIKLLHPDLVVPGIAGLVTVLVGGLEAETAVHAVDQGYRPGRAGLGTLPTAQAEIRHAPVVGLVVLDELEVGIDLANADAWADTGYHQLRVSPPPGQARPRFHKPRCCPDRCRRRRPGSPCRG